MPPLLPAPDLERLRPPAADLAAWLPPHPSHGPLDIPTLWTHKGVSQQLSGKVLSYACSSTSYDSFTEGGLHAPSCGRSGYQGFMLCLTRTAVIFQGYAAACQQQ